MTKRIAVSVGCPCGIGPEVSVAAACADKSARILLVGDAAVIRIAAKGRGVGVARVVSVLEPNEAWTMPRGHVAVWQPTASLRATDRVPGRPTKAAGAAQLAWVDAGCDLVVEGKADALVTGPVSKDVVVQSGAPGSRLFTGHTEHLQRRLHAREVVMAFSSPALTTSLVTTHLAVSRISHAITPTAVARATYWLAWLLARTTKGVPRVAIASLNPHAGENGLLGREEITRISPGIARARKRLDAEGIEATLDGPIPAETAFRQAANKQWEGVVAMYHDQATIPMKLLTFGEAVNISLGLPIVRTSVDHGTAYDRAGKWTADESGMRAAIALAQRLA